MKSGPVEGRKQQEPAEQNRCSGRSMIPNELAQKWFRELLCGIGFPDKQPVDHVAVDEREFDRNDIGKISAEHVFQPQRLTNKYISSTFRAAAEPPKNRNRISR